MGRPTGCLMGIIIPWNVPCDVPRDKLHPMGHIIIHPGPSHRSSNGTSHGMDGIPWDERLPTGMGCMSHGVSHGTSHGIWNGMNVLPWACDAHYKTRGCCCIHRPPSRSLYEAGSMLVTHLCYILSCIVVVPQATDRTKR